MSNCRALEVVGQTQLQVGEKWNNILTGEGQRNYSHVWNNANPARYQKDNQIISEVTLIDLIECCYTNRGSLFLLVIIFRVKSSILLALGHSCGNNIGSSFYFNMMDGEEPNGLFIGSDWQFFDPHDKPKVKDLCHPFYPQWRQTWHGMPGCHDKWPCLIRVCFLK